MPRLRIAMALYGEITNDSRVLREAQTLAQAGHAVSVYCTDGRIPADAQFRMVSRPSGRSRSGAVKPGRMTDGGRMGGLRPVLRNTAWLSRYALDLYAWGRWAVRAAGKVDVWHAHDLIGLLAVAPHLGSSTRLVYDSHEIFVDSGTAARMPRSIRALLGRLERHYVDRVEALVTVNEAYAKVLERTRPRRTVIVRNCPPIWMPGAARSTLLRDAIGGDAAFPIVLYHGLFAPHRGIEQLIEAMATDDLASAHLALLGFGELRPELERLASEPRFAGRVHVVDAVPPGHLLDWVSGADVDVIALERSSLNHWLCTPNKLWESLATGVPVVVSDFPVMRGIVFDDPDGPLGGVCDPVLPDSIASAVREILAMAPAGRDDLRARCLKAAHERWNWERESARLVALYADLAGRPPRGRGSR